MKETKHAIWKADGEWIVEPRDRETKEPRGDRLSFPARAAALLYIMKLDAPRLHAIASKIAFRHARAIAPTELPDNDIRVNPFSFDHAFTQRLLNAAILVKAGDVSFTSARTAVSKTAQVRSFSDPTTVYQVSSDGCDCGDYTERGFESLAYGRYCKHTLAVKIAAVYDGELDEESTPDTAEESTPDFLDFCPRQPREQLQDPTVTTARGRAMSERQFLKLADEGEVALVREISEFLPAYGDTPPQQLHGWRYEFRPATESEFLAHRNLFEDGRELLELLLGSLPQRSRSAADLREVKLYLNTRGDRALATAMRLSEHVTQSSLPGLQAPPVMYH